MKVDGVQAFLQRAHVGRTCPLLPQFKYSCHLSICVQLIQALFSLCRSEKHLCSGCLSPWPPGEKWHIALKGFYNEEARIAVIFSTKLSSSVEDGTQGLTHSGDYRQVLYH